MSFVATSRTRFLYGRFFADSMTRLVLDPATLPIEFPRASDSRVYRVRLIAQIVEYNDEACCLTVVKAPTVPQIHTTIVLDDIEEDGKVQINVLNIVDRLNLDAISPGSVVSIVGYYNGQEINPVECDAVNANAMMLGLDVSMMVAMSQMKDIG